MKAGPTKDGGLGGLKCALGGVSCTFRREIKPYEKYEIWSRVLCWDEKWLYIVSHFVRAGAVKPTSYRLAGPSSTSKRSRKAESDAEKKHPFSCTEAESKKFGFASAISKYVFKQGRKTIPAEDVLRELNLLPFESDPSSDLKANGFGTASGSEDSVWDLKRVQQENHRGLQLANLFNGLDGLHEVFSGNSAAALGKFGPLPW
jgi:hypothetical protein